MDSNIDFLFNKIASNKIKKYREEKNLSLEDVVKKMNYSISRQMLFKYENNLARMKNNVFVDICNALCKNPADVYKEINIEVHDTVDGIFDIDKEPIGFTMVNSETGEKKIMMKVPKSELLNAKYSDSTLSNEELEELKKQIASLGVPELNPYKDKVSFDNAELVDINTDTVSIPVLGTIRAGMPIEAQEEIIDYVDIPREWTKGGKQFFGLKIKGNSMSPKYAPGDTVVFESTEDFEYANNKDSCIMVNGFDATFKKFNINQSGVTLTPLNLENEDGYTTTFYDIEQVRDLPVRVIGIARRKISDIE